MRIRSALLVSALLTGASAIAQAGPYQDDLSKCLISSTTKEDRIDLVKWIFAAMGSHPAVKPIASVTPEQLDGASRSVAKLFGRLLTKTCQEQAQKAIQYEGPATLQLSFQLLGQVASRELFTDPAVLSAMTGLTKYIDEKQLTAALQAQPTSPRSSTP
jgi:hypothetical protein